ncbi:hypothetical protein BDZ97DRAFT_1757693 [Flammula alnicola]|nr:hypothetical protein BDZ97DRAFT_1757693 [Flammula alnicola]
MSKRNTRTNKSINSAKMLTSTSSNPSASDPVSTTPSSSASTDPTVSTVSNTTSSLAALHFSKIPIKSGESATGQVDNSTTPVAPAEDPVAVEVAPAPGASSAEKECSPACNPGEQADYEAASPPTMPLNELPFAEASPLLQQHHFDVDMADPGAVPGGDGLELHGFAHLHQERNEEELAAELMSVFADEPIYPGVGVARAPSFHNPNNIPVGNYHTLMVSPKLRNPVPGFSRLFLVREGVYQIVTRSQTALEVPAALLKSVLRYAAEINNARNHPERRIRLVEPAAYRDIVDALNDDPKAHGRLPIIEASGVIHFSMPGYPLRIDYPDPERIRKAVALQDLMGEDADPRLMQNVALHAAAHSLGLGSKRAPTGPGRGGPRPFYKRGRHA